MSEYVEDSAAHLSIEDKETINKKFSKPGFDRNVICIKYGISGQTLYHILKGKNPSLKPSFFRVVLNQEQKEELMKEASQPDFDHNDALLKYDISR